MGLHQPTLQSPVLVRPSMQRPDLPPGAITLLSSNGFNFAYEFSRSSAKWVWGPDGYLHKVEAGEIAIQHDPITGKELGPSIEKQRTNVLLDNRDLSTGNWSGTATVTQDAMGLDGAANSAWTITDNDAGGLHNKSQSRSVPDDSNPHSVSFFIKKDSGNEPDGYFGLRVSLTGGTALDHVETLDSRDGTSSPVSSRSDGSASVYDAGDWWRLVVTLTNNGTGNTSLNIRPYPAWTDTLGADFNDATTGSIVYDFGQVELNASFATSPIETGSQVTRDADVPEITDMSWFSPESTVLVEYTVNGYDEYAYVWQFDFPSNRIALLANSSGSEKPRLYSSGAGSDSYGFSLQKNKTHKVSASFGSNLASWAVNSNLVGSDISFDTFTGPDKLAIGYQPSKTFNSINGTIKQIIYWPYRLSDAELQRITA